MQQIARTKPSHSSDNAGISRQRTDVAEYAGLIDLPAKATPFGAHPTPSDLRGGTPWTVREHSAWSADIMHRTIFHTPIVSTVLRAGSVAFLHLTGWTIAGQLPPNAPKCVLIAAPHTSNWDLPYTLMVAFVLRLHIYWMGKQSLFRQPFGGLMMWLGGIPVNRQQSTQLVAASIAAIAAADGELQLVVPPEGTRGRTRHWKTGFYHIALGANVPIVMAYMDFSRKISGLGPVFTPTGDVARDMASIKAFYAPFKGRNASLFAAD